VAVAELDSNPGEETTGFVVAGVCGAAGAAVPITGADVLLAGAFVFFGVGFFVAAFAPPDSLSGATVCQPAAGVAVGAGVADSVGATVTVGVGDGVSVGTGVSVATGLAVGVALTVTTLSVDVLSI